MVYKKKWRIKPAFPYPLGHTRNTGVTHKPGIGRRGKDLRRECDAKRLTLFRDGTPPDVGIGKWGNNITVKILNPFDGASEVGDTEICVEREARTPLWQHTQLQ